MRLTDIAQAVAQHGAEKYVEKKAGMGLALPIGIGMGLSLPNTFHKMEDRYRDTRRTLDAAALQTLYPGATKNAASAFPSWWPTDNNTRVDARTGGRVVTPPGNVPPWAQSAVAGATGMNPAKLDPKSIAIAPSWGDVGGQVAGQGIMAGLSSFLGPIAGAPGKAIASRIERAMSGREFGEIKDAPHQLGNAAIQAFGKEVGTMGAGLLRDIANKAMSVAGNIGNESARTAILQQLRKEDPVLQEADDKTLMEAYHTMTRFAPVLSTDKNAVRSFLRQAVMSGNGPDYVTIKLLADSERAVTGEKKE